MSPDPSPRLVVFDCDGTLVDSQYMIMAAMEVAFAAQDLTPPSLERVRRIIGLSLGQAVAELANESQLDDAAVSRLVADYKGAFHDLRAEGGHAQEPLFPGIRAMLETLSGAGYSLGIATGKSARGLGKVLELHDISRYFVTVQTADNHPSKPHPAMLQAAIAEAGADAGATILIGDTSYDMLMAVAAGAAALGVAWGYHPPGELSDAGASHVAGTAAEIPPLVRQLLGPDEIMDQTRGQTTDQTTERVED